MNAIKNLSQSKRSHSNLFIQFCYLVIFLVIMIMNNNKDFVSACEGQKDCHRQCPSDSKYPGKDYSTSCIGYSKTCLKPFGCSVIKGTCNWSGMGGTDFEEVCCDRRCKKSSDPDCTPACDI